MRLIKNFVHNALKLTPYELRRRNAPALPPPSLESVKLAVASYIGAKRRPIVVQVGACDGISGDPLHAFVKSGRLRAVLVEPIPSSFRALQQAYAGVPDVTLVNTAIARDNGTLVLFKVKDGARSIDPFWGTQLASFERRHLLRHGVADGDIEAVRVPSATLATLMSQCGLDEIDVLQIDTEGLDAEIVHMALALRLPPECIAFESVNLSAAAADGVFTALEQNGYAWLHDSWNTLALHRRWFKRWEHIPEAFRADGVFAT